MPSPPGRVEPKYSSVPSQESDGLVSAPSAELTFGPRLTGADHTAEPDERVAEYRSAKPSVPGLVLEKNSSRPSRRRFGCMSSAALFAPGTRVGGPKTPPWDSLTYRSLSPLVAPGASAENPPGRVLEKYSTGPLAR